MSPIAKKANGRCEDLLFTDIHVFNEKLADWLIKYNGIRPQKDWH